MPKKNESNYPVGYCKPPKNTQFKPGKSGNPNGRPRKSTTLDDAIDRELRAKITITEGAIHREVTKCVAVAKRFVNEAIGGNIRSTALLLKRTSQGPSDQENNLTALVHEFREISRRIDADKLNETEASGSSPDISQSTQSEGENS